MDLIISLIIGGVVGWLASIVMKTNARMGWIANVLVGVVGSALGFWIAGLLGIALLGIVVVHSFNRELDRRLAPMELSPEVRRVIDAQRVKLAGAEFTSNIDERTRFALKQAIDESFVFGFRLVMLTSLCLALASALVAFMVIENK